MDKKGKDCATNTNNDSVEPSATDNKWVVLTAPINTVTSKLSTSSASGTLSDKQHAKNTRWLVLAAPGIALNIDKLGKEQELVDSRPDRCDTNRE